MAQSTGQEADPYAGYLNHLNPSQEKAFAAFKDLLISKSLYIPATSTTQASHTDTRLLNVLRARKFDVPGAEKQFASAEAWRRDNNIDDVFEGIDTEQFREGYCMYPQWTGRQDKRGVPVHYYEVAPLTSEKVAAYHKSAANTTVVAPVANGKDDFVPPPRPEGVKDLPKSTYKTDKRLLRLFALYEGQSNFTMPLCSTQKRPTPEFPVCQGATITDISNVGLKQFWNLRSHMQDPSILSTANYPETLDWIFIIGAPSFFPVVWGWIKNWFDPVTVSKISILSASEVLPALEKQLDIEDIPEKYGGKLKFKFGGAPNLSPAILDSLIWEEGVEHVLPRGPLRVEEAKSSSGRPGMKELWAIGSEGGKSRRIKLATIRDQSHTKPDEEPKPMAENSKAVEDEDDNEDKFVEAKETLSNDVIEEKISDLKITDKQAVPTKQATAA